MRFEVKTDGAEAVPSAAPFPADAGGFAADGGGARLYPDQHSGVPHARGARPRLAQRNARRLGDRANYRGRGRGHACRGAGANRSPFRRYRLHRLSARPSAGPPATGRYHRARRHREAPLQFHAPRGHGFQRPALFQGGAGEPRCGGGRVHHRQERRPPRPASRFRDARCGRQAAGRDRRIHRPGMAGTPPARAAAARRRIAHRGRPKRRDHLTRAPAGAFRGHPHPGGVPEARHARLGPARSMSTARTERGASSATFRHLLPGSLCQRRPLLGGELPGGGARDADQRVDRGRWCAAGAAAGLAGGRAYAAPAHPGPHLDAGALAPGRCDGEDGRKPVHRAKSGCSAIPSTR